MDLFAHTEKEGVREGGRQERREGEREGEKKEREVGIKGKRETRKVGRR